MNLVKKTLTEATLKGLTSDSFQTDADGNLVIKNSDLASLIKTNVVESEQVKEGGDAKDVIVGVIII